MTIQAGRWTPTAEELADVAATVSPEVFQSMLDCGILASGSKTEGGGIDATLAADELPAASPARTIGGVDKTVAGDAADGGGTTPEVTAGDVTVDGSDSGSGSAAGQSDSGAVVRAGSKQDSGDVSETVESGEFRSSQDDSSPQVGGSVASQAVRAAATQVLEKTLVIQPRLLRSSEQSPGSSIERADYDLLTTLGEGGMGIVYAARQQSIRRVVALKMLKGRRTHVISQREKFLAEAVITGDLEHPNIVPIYDLGRDEQGAIFYAMKRVQGTPWDEVIDRKALHENLEILLKVADAVAFAHSKHVIHRDLKPENVMLGDFGEVLVMDWGLAISTFTSNGFVMGGTPAYMAPEMAVGPAAAIGVHSDVYLLGAILYEIVTGLRPHTGQSVTRCLAAAGENRIVPSNKTGELVEVALTAMATRPDDRYPSVRDFQTAVRTYLSHSESVALAARAETDLAEAQRTDRYDSYARALFGFQEAVAMWDGNRTARQGASRAALAYARCAQQREDYELGLSLLRDDQTEHRSLIRQLRQAQHERDQRIARLRAARRIGLALAAAIFAIVTGAFFWIRHEANRARQAELVAVQQRRQAVDQRRLADLERRRAEAARHEAVAAHQSEQEARRLADSRRIEAEQARAEEQQQRNLAEQARQREQYEGYIAKIGLAAAKIEENAFESALTLLQQCPPGLRHWEWGRLQYLCTRDLDSIATSLPLETVALSPDERHLAVGGWGGEVLIFAIDDPQPLRVIDTGGTHVFSLAYSPDGQRLAIGGNRRPDYLSIWDPASGQWLQGLEGHADAVLSIQWDRQGQRLLTGSYDHTARLWDLASGEGQVFRAHDWWVWSAEFSEDEQQILTASQDGAVMLWDATSSEVETVFLGHRRPVLAATFSAHDGTIASGDDDGRIMLWRADEIAGQSLQQALAGTEESAQSPAAMTWQAHGGAVRSLRASADGRRLLSGGNDNVVCLWDLPSGDLIKQLRGHSSRVSDVAFTADQQRVVSAGYDQQIKLWGIAAYEEARVLGGRVLKGHHDSILGASFSPDGSRVATASRDRSALLWEVDTARAFQSFTEGHSYLASKALFMPDELRVLTAAIDNTARLWDLASGTQLAVLDGTGIHAAVAIAPAGDWIASGSDRQSILIWSADGERMREFEGLRRDVTALAISDDGRRILAGDGGGSCQMLAADSGQLLWQSDTHARGITQVAFVPGADRVLSAGLDHVVAIRDAGSGQEVDQQTLPHPAPVTSLAIAADGQHLLTACADDVVRRWDLNAGDVDARFLTGGPAATGIALAPAGASALITTADRRVYRWRFDQDQFDQDQAGRNVSAADQPPLIDLAETAIPLWSARYSRSGRRILSVGGNEARLWDSQTGQALLTLSPQAAVSGVDFSPDGKRLVSGSWDNAARIWDVKTGQAAVKLGGGHARFVNASRFSPDGQRVVTASDDRTAMLWDAADGQPLGSLVGHQGRVTDVTFSPAGDRVLTASEDQTARIWDAHSRQCLHILTGHSQGLLCARFSPDGQLVLTGGEDTTARLWHAETGQPLEIVFDGHTASVTAVAFTPDGRRLFTASQDKTTKLWDPQTGQEVLTLAAHSRELSAVDVSPDGRTVLTASRDGTAILWLSSDWQQDAAVAYHDH